MTNGVEREEQKIKEQHVKVHQIVYIYFGMIVLLILLVIITRLYLINLDKFVKLFIYIACAGGLGSTVCNALGLNINEFKPEWFWWYFFYPFAGIIYGTFAFLFVAGGLMALSGTAASVNLFDAKTVMFYCSLSFLVGYAEDPFTRQLNDLAQALFKNTGSTNQTTDGQILDALKQRLDKNEITQDQFDKIKEQLKIKI